MSANAAATDESIRPFQFHASDEALADLRRRIAATNWPDRELVDRPVTGRAARDDAEARALLGDANTTGARSRRRLNALPQFMTEIDGVDIHFIHVRSKHPERVAGHRHARVARLDHRADEDHRAADQSDGLTAEARRTRSTW